MWRGLCQVDYPISEERIVHGCMVVRNRNTCKFGVIIEVSRWTCMRIYSGRCGVGGAAAIVG